MSRHGYGPHRDDYATQEAFDKARGPSVAAPAAKAFDRLQQLEQFKAEILAHIQQKLEGGVRIPMTRYGEQMLSTIVAEVLPPDYRVAVRLLPTTVDQRIRRISLVAITVFDPNNAAFEFQTEAS